MPESFASYDQSTSLWRTSQLCLTGELSEYLETWPRAGMMRNGKCYRRPRLVLNTVENESIFWPTPQASPGMTYKFTQYGSDHALTRKGNLEDVILRRYPVDAVGCWMNVRFVEQLMGFPLYWTDLKGLGNAVVPQVAEWIGKQILEFEVRSKS